MKKRQVEIIINRIKEIEGMKVKSYKGFIPFIDIKNSFALHETIAVNGTANTLILKEEGHLKFITQMMPGCSMDLQKHDCFEWCKVLSGYMGDGLQKEKIWTVGDIVEFLPLQDHIPLNRSTVHPLWITVDFSYDKYFYKKI
jgi:hypothetical protein